MKLPILQSSPQRQMRQIINFGGINMSESAQDGELSDSMRVSNRQYPCLSCRIAPTVLKDYDNASAVYSAFGKLLVISGKNVFYDGKLIGSVKTDAKKQFATVNTKVVIYPDKLYFDVNDRELKSIDAEEIGYPGGVTYTTDSIVFAETMYEDRIVSDSELEVSGYVTRVVPNGLQTSGSSAGKYSYNSSATGRVKIESLETGKFFCNDPNGNVDYYGYYELLSYNSATGKARVNIHSAVSHFSIDFTRKFNAGEQVALSGSASAGYNKAYTIKQVSENKLTFEENSFAEGNEGNKITISRTSPDFELIAAHENRLFGVSNNTIYGSALGNPLNFSAFQNLATDSYAVAVGTDGNFTGLVSYGSQLLCFKENILHKLIGTNPKDYYINSYTVPGIKEECSPSAVIINEVLYYMGKDGYYAYSGSIPRNISLNFGIVRFNSAVSECLDRRYYTSAFNEGDGKYELLIYDTEKGLWIKDDDTQICGFAKLGGKLYGLDSDGRLTVYEDNVNVQEMWSCTLAPISETINQKKCYSKFYLRYELAEGAYMRVEISCDGESFREVWRNHQGDRERISTACFRPTRCDTLRIRLSGKGQFKLKQLVREYEIGSEV